MREKVKKEKHLLNICNILGTLECLLSMNDCESTVSTDFEVTNKVQQTSKLANMEICD